MEHARKGLDLGMEEFANQFGMTGRAYRNVIAKRYSPERMFLLCFLKAQAERWPGLEEGRAMLARLLKTKGGKR
jgi:hypothetical protein